MKCQKCNSDRLIYVGGLDAVHECTDFEDPKNEWRILGIPPGVGLGDGSPALDFCYCLHCGQIQGDFPVTEEALRAAFDNGTQDASYTAAMEEYEAGEL